MSCHLNVFVSIVFPVFLLNSRFPKFCSHLHYFFLFSLFIQNFSFVFGFLDEFQIVHFRTFIISIRQYIGIHFHISTFLIYVPEILIYFFQFGIFLVFFQTYIFIHRIFQWYVNFQILCAFLQSLCYLICSLFLLLSGATMWMISILANKVEFIVQENGGKPKSMHVICFVFMNKVVNV